MILGVSIHQTFSIELDAFIWVGNCLPYSTVHDLATTQGRGSCVQKAPYYITGLVVNYVLSLVLQYSFI